MEAVKVRAVPPEVKSVGLLMHGLVTAMVDDPNAVQVDTVRCGESFVYRVRVAQADLGKVVGKQGHTARALRTLLVGIGKNYELGLALDIEGGRRVQVL